jgi:hypothetical protein
MNASTLLAITVLGASALPAAEFLPLQTGNFWIYRSQQTGETLSIRVGTPAVIGGQVYHRLNGYVSQPLWVRPAQDGSLWYRDEEFDRDGPLTLFEILDRAWFNAPFRPCGEQIGQAQGTRVEYQGPAGRFTGALEIRYQIIGCADVGVTNELYLENIGMLRRTVTTITGPRSYDLVEARVGSLTLSEAPTAGLQVSAAVAPGAGQILATLRLVKVGGSPITLRWASSQEYELILRNAAGEVLYRWSEGKVFLPVVRDEVIESGFLRTVPIELRDALPEGIYTLEAWLTAGAAGREFSASVAFEVKKEN